MPINEDIRDITELIESVADDLNDVGKRVLALRVQECIQQWLSSTKPKAQRPNLVPFTIIEAREYGSKLMDFGFHKGTPIKDIPRDYLEWLADKSRNNWQELWKYLNSPQMKTYIDD